MVIRNGKSNSTQIVNHIKVAYKYIIFKISNTDYFFIAFNTNNWLCIIFVLIVEVLYLCIVSGVTVAVRWS